jgi:O-methyltransferase involved in polyketide biosynthesis
VSSEKIKLTGVQETLLMPLWGRAYETRKNKPLLVDKAALNIVESIDYDFSEIEERVNPLSRASWIARSIYFDSKIKAFLEKHPEGSVINIGCGLDTTYERINCDNAIWYELDFPEVIEIRKTFIQESKNRVFLPYSVFETNWYDRIKNKKHVFVMFAGVIYYFEADEIKRIFEEMMDKFEDTYMAFDYSSPLGIKIANKKVIEKGGMDKEAYLKWGIEDIYEIESWNNKIKIIENMKMFYEHKKRYPFWNRIGMNISDALSIMSLAYLRMEGKKMV